MTYASTILADSPVSYWRLGESSGNFADSADSNTGNALGTPTYGAAGALSGDANTAVSYAGASGDRIDMTTTGFPTGSSARTLEAWIKTSAATRVPLIWYGTTSSGQACEWMLNASGIMEIGNWSASATFGSDLRDGNWHHVAVTISGTSVYGYIDGTEYGPTTVSGWNTVSSASHWIGCDGTYYASGTYDEVAIYASALSSSQIAAHYAAGTAVTPTWTTPADTVSMSLTPDLQFDSPVSASAQHFQLQLDTANTFDTGNLRTYDSSTSQTNWTYWNGSTWTAMPATGLPAVSSGNEVRYTVTSALSAATWYRRVRAGTGT